LSIKRKQDLMCYINKQHNKDNINISITSKIIYNASNYTKLMQQLNRYILRTKIKINNRILCYIVNY